MCICLHAKWMKQGYLMFALKFRINGTNADNDKMLFFVVYLGWFMGGIIIKYILMVY